VNRDELRKYLALIERKIQHGNRSIEEQRMHIKNQVATGLNSQSESLATLTRLLRAQRDLEDSHGELLKSINS
jgi:hypothetical protein